MSKNKDFDVIYAVRNKETKKIVRNTKCKGGSYYTQKPSCQQRCNNFNTLYRMFDNLKDIEYEVGEYAVIDIDKYKELLGENS